MEPAYHGIEEETVTRLPSKAFDEFLKALDRPVPQTARDLIGMEPDWLWGSRPRVGPGPATCSTGPAAAVAPIYERLPLRARDAEKHGHRPYNVSRKKQQALRRGTEGLPSGGESDLGQRLV